MSADRPLAAVEGGGTWFRWAVGAPGAPWLAAGRIPTGGPDATLDALVGALAPFAPRAVGVATFGPVRLEGPDAGTTLRTPKAGWDGVPIGPRLAAALGAPVVVETDVNAAALAEATWGAARGERTVAYATVGTGVGVGWVVDGRPHHGTLHPEGGHVPVPRLALSDGTPDPFPGACPFHGRCLEGLASGPAIAARAGAPAEGLPDDHPALALAARYLGVGLAAVALLVAPACIVVGGGVAARPGFLAAAAAELERALGDYPAPAAGRGRLRAAELADPGLVGAALLAARAAGSPIAGPGAV